MWGIGGAVDMLAVLILVGCYLGTQDRAERRGPPDPAPRAARELDGTTGLEAAASGVTVLSRVLDSL